jgi:exportin-2 (importin alpha re-exporter)
VRTDLAPPSAEGTSRRQAAAELVKALVAAGAEQDTTALVREVADAGLANAAADAGPDGDGWRAKDSAVYLMTAVAARGGTAASGVTATNPLVDVVAFFSQHVFSDLQADTGAVHPVLQVDAIRFLHTFRNQLTKEQLLSVLPLLHKHLGSPNVVCCTYAAVTIERILFIKQGGKLL